ncbi:MAG: phosphatidylglycerophosphatase A [Candidatus Eisenbacteria bacterium]
MSFTDRLAWLIYSFFGSGRAPVAPGTAGSAAAALLLLLPGRVPGVPAWERPEWALAIALVFFAGVWAAGRAEARFGRDPGIVVIDEVAGMMVALFLLPNSAAAVAGAFLLFRFFDIVKPFPVRAVERARGGWGVMLDDVLAGCYAHVALRLLLALLGRLS